VELGSRDHEPSNPINCLHLVIEIKGVIHVGRAHYCLLLRANLCCYISCLYVTTTFHILSNFMVILNLELTRSHRRLKSENCIRIYTMILEISASAFISFCGLRVRL